MRRILILLVAVAGCGDVVKKLPDGGGSGDDDGGSSNVGNAGRLIAPISSSSVTSRKPTVKWELLPDSTDPIVEFCSDPACANVVETGIVTGSTAIPSQNLSAGVVFWRVRATGPATEPMRETRTWHFRVGANRTIDTSWGSTYDANADGIADVAVGAPCGPAPGVGMCGSGRVHVYLGSATGLAATAIVLMTTDADGARFGDRIASAGDVNGDGFADLLVTAMAASPPGKPNGGRVYVFLGSSSGVQATPFATLDGGDGANVGFGDALTALGDYDGDGYGDFVIGVPGKNLVRLYRGGASSVIEGPMLTVSGLPSADAQFGTAIAACDLDGNARPDLIVGSPRGSKVAGQADNGAIYVFLGNGTTLAESATNNRNGAEQGSFGASVVCDDFFSSGYPLVVVGRPAGYRTPPSTGYEDGNVYSYENIQGTLSTSRGVISGLASSSYSWAGTTAGPAGDVDNDGYLDLAIASQYDLRIIYGGVSNRFRPTPTILLTRDPHHSAADVNGDGFSDILVSNEQGTLGKLNLFVGGATGASTTAAVLLGSKDDEFGGTVSAGPSSGAPYY